jgi:hypothetical protein
MHGGAQGSVDLRGRTTATTSMAATPPRRSPLAGMHNALLTIRLPLENFYNSLTDEQQQRLRRDEPDSGEIGANGVHAQMCAEPAAGIADSTCARSDAQRGRPSSKAPAWKRCG